MRGSRRPPSPRRRAALAAGAGALGDGLLLAALWASGAVLSREASPLGGGSPGVGVLLAGAVFSAGVLGGTIPAAVVGTGWRRGFLASLTGHAGACVAVFGALVPLRPFDGWPAYLGVELALAATIAGALWGGGGPRRRTVVAGGVLLAACLALGGLLYGLPSAALGLLTWSLLPALAAAERRENAS